VDDTLYPLNSRIAATCTKNIKDYMNKNLGAEKRRVLDLSRESYETYGTTIVGLGVVGYEFDYEYSHSFVHRRFPYENLKPDHALKNFLLSMPQ
jgi:hypothetical protein